MAIQDRNGDMVQLLRADLQDRYEPQFALANSVSLHSTLQAVRAVWTLGANVVTGAGPFATDVAGSYDLSVIHEPQFSRYNLVPYIDFTRAGAQYLEYADNANFDIIGTESYIANPGLTLGGWVWCDAASMGNLTGICCKYDTAGNQRAYALYKLAADTVRFSVSTDGINDVVVTTAAALVVGAWNHIVARYTPGAELALFVNKVKTTNVVGVPATIFNSSASLRLADRRAEYLDGRLSQWFVCAASLADAQCGVLYEQTRAGFGV